MMKMHITISLEPEMVEKLREKKEKDGIPLSVQISIALKKAWGERHG